MEKDEAMAQLGPQGARAGTIEEGMAWIGYETPPVKAPEPINGPAIRLFCELVEDSNPAYWQINPTDESVRDTAPPGTLMTWCMPRTWRPNGGNDVPPALQREVPLPGDTLLVTESDTSYFKPIRIGETLQYIQRLASIVPRRTRLGPGCFLTIEHQYANDLGEPVAVSTLTIFRYSRTETRSAAIQGDTRGRSKSPTDQPEGHAEAAVASLEYAVTYRKCVIGAAATRDFNPVHYDRSYVATSSAPDVFINTAAYLGLIGRLVTEHAGPKSFISRIKLNMLGMNIPGDTLRLEGFTAAPGSSDPAAKAMSILASNERVGITTRGLVEFLPSARV